MVQEKDITKAQKIVAKYTLAASATGALPVPAASAAIAAENAAMISHIASLMGQKISVKTVVSSMGVAVTLNAIGRTLFIEGAKFLSWGTGNIWAALALGGLGSATAGMQTYIIGCLSLEIGKNGGQLLEAASANRIVQSAKQGYEPFIAAKRG